MKDEQVRQQRPILLREEGHQHLLNLYRVGLTGKAQPNAEPADMSVDNDAFIDAESVAEYDIGGLSSDSWKFDERVHRLRYLSLMAFHDRGGHPEKALRLVAEKTGALDQLLENLRISRSQGSSGRECPEQPGGDHVDAFIGALRAQDSCDEQLERGIEIELAVGVGILPLEAGQNLGGVSL